MKWKKFTQSNYDNWPTFCIYQSEPQKFLYFYHKPQWVFLFSLFTILYSLKRCTPSPRCIWEEQSGIPFPCLFCAVSISFLLWPPPMLVLDSSTYTFPQPLAFVLLRMLINLASSPFTFKLMKNIDQKQTNKKINKLFLLSLLQHCLLLNLPLL